MRALEETDVPLSFVWGMLDPVSGAHMAERIRERLPESPSWHSSTSPTRPPWKRRSRGAGDARGRGRVSMRPLAPILALVLGGAERRNGAGCPA